MASRDYPEEVVFKALELASAIGMRPAARSLEIPEGTIRTWSRSPAYSARWAELRRQNAPKWRERAAIPMEDLVDEYGEAEAMLLKRLLSQAEELEPRDIATALRSIAVAKGVTADHAGKLRGQPAQVIEHRMTAERLQAGIAKLVEMAETVDGTAEELPQIDPPKDPDG